VCTFGNSFKQLSVLKNWMVTFALSIVMTPIAMNPKTMIPKMKMFDRQFSTNLTALNWLPAREFDVHCFELP
jgi:heme/copper-type cytochrome/quinol oxidase subunit 4